MLELFFFNVGHGDSIAIHFPDESWGVIDCQKLDTQSESQVLKFLKLKQVERLKFLCLTHPHDDHLKGIDDLLNYYESNINEFWTYNLRVYSPLEQRDNSSLKKFLIKLRQINNYAKYNELGFLDRKNDRQFPFKRQKIKQKGKRYVKKVQDLYPGIQGKSSKRVA